MWNDWTKEESHWRQDHPWIRQENLGKQIGRKVRRAIQDFQPAIRHFEPNDEHPSWVECQRHWDYHIEVTEWTIVEWSEKRKIIYWKLQQA